ncbi:MAG: DUF1697 domain-containing protein [Myxococcales bacterium]|nr:DUF1697 domain-containing protein [Myxococcales bacterium]
MGGKNRLPMKDLVAIFEAAGCAEVKTYIQSGNVVFSAPAKVAKGLAEAVPEAISAQFGLRVPVVLRSAADYLAAVEANPFLAEGVPEGALYLAFLSAKPTAARVAKLDPARSPPDAFRVVGMQVYMHCPDGVANTKLTNAYFDSTLGVVSTARNWRTVLTLAGMLEA